MKNMFKKFIALTFVLTTVFSVITLTDKPVTVSAESNIGAFDVGLSMTESHLKNNGVVSQYNSSFLYLEIENGNSIPYSGNWDLKYTSVGDAVKVNGVAKETNLIKTKENEAALAEKTMLWELFSNRIPSVITWYNAWYLARQVFCGYVIFLLA